MFNIKIPFVMASHVLKRAGTTLLTNKSKAAGIGVDTSDSSLLKYNQAGTVRTLVSTDGTQTLTNKSFVSTVQTIAGDGAVTLASGLVLLTKGSAAAISVAAPGASGIGMRITITTGSDFAHVVTFTGTTLQDGTAGANSTWTAAAVQGSSITFVGVSATKWNVESFNLGTIAP